jgi:hypothetical protein
MDPDVTLREILSLANEIVAIAEEDPNEYDANSVELAERALDLDDWLVGGGFLPRAWKQRRSARRAGIQSIDPEQVLTKSLEDARTLLRNIKSAANLVGLEEIKMRSDDIIGQLDYLAELIEKQLLGPRR